MVSMPNVGSINTSATVSNSVPVVVQKIARTAKLEPASVQDVYQCTSLQASLLAASLHGFGNYVSTFVFDLSSTPYSPKDVKSACETLYDRTPILRTCFLESRGTFLQAVTDAPLSWEEHESLQAYLDLDLNKTIQLGNALARFAWISDVDDRVYMVWSLHHALYDEWSVNLLFKDLSALVKSSVLAIDSERRPKFSRFIKALVRIDQGASKRFWQNALANLDQCESILPTISEKFETWDHAEFCFDFVMSQNNHQPSTLAIAAWSIFIAKISGSETVAFGNITNGRTAHVPGIVDICGPTMTTVPYVVSVSVAETADSFLKGLEQTRNGMLPFEQTGLDEYRQRVGTGRFDTLLSIRLSQSAESETDDSQDLRPNAVMGRQIRHPCCLYLDVVFEPQQCTFKASFDAHYIDSDHIATALQQISTCVKELTHGSDTDLKTLLESIQIPKLIIAQTNDQPGLPTNDVKSAVDPKILQQVQEAARDISPLHDIHDIGPATSLRELGLDSLNTVVLARALSKVFDVSVPFNEVTGLRKTVLDIANSIEKTINGSNEDRTSKLALLDLAEEYVKDFQCAKNLTETECMPSSILLTGASGYVGISILRHLLVSTDDSIILLVRCNSADEGINRICQTARKAQWQAAEIALLDYRVEIWPSDLGVSQLGLDARYLENFKNIRTIIHNGARVDFSLDYDDLEATNVAATAFLLSRQLSSAPIPSFVYLTGGRSCPLEPGESLETTASKLAVSNGYAQSKFVSEILLHRSLETCKDNERKARMSIVHPGIVIGSESIGVANTDDFIWRYVAASIQMQAYVPAVPTKREWINSMTVDAVALETISAAMGEDSAGQVERRLMRSGLPVARFWDIVIDALGSEYSLEPISEWEWLHRLEDDLSEKGVKHPLFSLSQLLLQGFLKGIGGAGPRPEMEPSKQAMKGSERAVAANVKYLKDVGFFSRDGGDILKADVFGRSKR